MLQFNEMTAEAAKGIRYILHDIDDTITNGGKLTGEAYAALWKLHDAGLSVIPVTGRPAGWCDMAVREWPIDAIVGENGAFVYHWKDGKPQMFCHPSIPKESVASKLSKVCDACLSGVPGCRVAKDQSFRICDLAIDFAEDEPRLSMEAAKKIQEIAESFGAVAKISSIHVNIWFGDYDKVSMSKLFMESVWNVKDVKESVLFFGDSANDEPMFAELPLSCGVSNICGFLPLMKQHPTYWIDGEGGYGFAKAADLLLKKRSQ